MTYNKLKKIFAAAFVADEVYEPSPHDRASFYGKAKIAVHAHYKVLKSYETIVGYKDPNGKVHRTWSGWSATTGRHIYAAFGIRKAAWDRLPVECE